eukprot:4443810-Pyramimonas_sp.AAC.1
MVEQTFPEAVRRRHDAIKKTAATEALHSALRGIYHLPRSSHTPAMLQVGANSLWDGSCRSPNREAFRDLTHVLRSTISCDACSEHRRLAQLCPYEYSAGAHFPPRQ